MGHQKETKQDVYQRITAKLVHEIEKGNIPWLQPWNNSIAAKAGTRTPPPMPILDIAKVWPTNAVSGNQYSGGNVLALWIHLFVDLKGKADKDAPMLFMTFKQARLLGGNVKRGEKGCFIIGYRDGVKKVEEDGEEVTKRWRAAFGHTVFHISQCEGVTLPERKERKEVVFDDPTGLDDKGWNKFVNKVGVTFKHGGIKAFYSIAGDFVQMPTAKAFHSPEVYKAVGCHEIVHWTGAPKRLDRFKTWKADTSSPEYSFEELIAEIGSAFLCAKLGIVQTELRHAAYLKMYLKNIKDDPKAIMKAASLAQKAAQFVLEKFNAGKTKRKATALGSTVQPSDSGRDTTGGKKGPRPKPSRAKASAVAAST